MFTVHRSQVSDLQKNADNDKTSEAEANSLGWCSG